MSERSTVAYIDGGARGNPGPAGYGVRIEGADGSVVHELSGAIGVATNNVAEYRGLIAALLYLDQGGYTDVLIRSDSQLLTKQMRGEYKVRNPALQALHQEATAVVRRLARVRFEHVPRAQNTEADRLANRAMDEATGTKPGERPTRKPGAPSVAPIVVSGGAIIGIGMDVEEVPRVSDLLDRYGDRFLTRVFTPDEVAYSRRRRFPAQHLTGRFAAKEAAMKALGTGHSRGVLWRDIEVVRVVGPPQLQFHGGARRHFEALGAARSVMTITHTRALALAQVLLLG